MNVREIALGVKRWAETNGMMGGQAHASTFDPGLIREIFGRVSVPVATGILQNRGISYIGVDELQDHIIIFTRKKLSVREYKLFEAASIGSSHTTVHFTFYQSDIAHIGGPPPFPPGILPYHLHNGRFTCGSSIYLGSEKGAGTLGCLLKDKAGTLYGLSNNHVTGGSNYAPLGLPIVAPGQVDVTPGRMNPETIGHHFRAYPFIDGLPGIVNADGNLDAAIFIVLDGNRISSMQRDRFDTPSRAVPIEVGMRVEKLGRTTGHSAGDVISEMVGYSAVNYSLDIIGGGRKIVYFDGVFGIKDAITTFSSPGDSGSLITTKLDSGERVAVGIIVAGSDDGVCLALSIDRILSYFDAELVSGHNV